MFETKETLDEFALAKLLFSIKISVSLSFPLEGRKYTLVFLGLKAFFAGFQKFLEKGYS